MNSNGLRIHSSFGDDQVTEDGARRRRAAAVRVGYVATAVEPRHGLNAAVGCIRAPAFRAVSTAAAICLYRHRRRRPPPQRDYEDQPSLQRRAGEAEGLVRGRVVADPRRVLVEERVPAAPLREV